jgi:hypothetical protein
MSKRTEGPVVSRAEYPSRAPTDWDDMVVVQDITMVCMLLCVECWRSSTARDKRPR